MEASSILSVSDGSTAHSLLEPRAMNPGQSPAERRSMILQTLNLLFEPNSVVEVRILNVGRDGTISGYFTDFTALVKHVERYDGKAPGIYITLNPVRPELLARAANRLAVHASKTTSDADIIGRRWLLIDIDPVRPAGISSSPSEHAAGLDKATSIRAYLRQLGWPEPIIADSGNGAHLLYKIDLPNDPASLQLCKEVLLAVAYQFDDEITAIDQTVYNAARICKLYGTMSCKGDSLPKRPHRRAYLRFIPKPRVAVSRELLADLARTVPSCPVESSSHSRSKGIDVPAWLDAHGLKVKKEGQWNDGHRWVLDQCPFNSEHNDSSAVIVQFLSGAVAFRCHHNGCTGKSWHELRGLMEPASNRSAATSTGGDAVNFHPAGHGAPPTENESIPEPLQREMEPSLLYPIDALGDTLGGAARALQEHIQAPVALCGQAVLAGASHVVQGSRQVVVDGRVSPASEFFISLGDSGERKSAIDKIAFAPHREFQRDLVSQYAALMHEYDIEAQAFEKQRSVVLSDKNAETAEAKESALRALGEAPKRPLSPVLFIEEPTYEGLVKRLMEGIPIAGIIADEGARFLAGHAMNDENELKTAAGLSSLWDGSDITRSRVWDGTVSLSGRRVCLHLMLQPLIASKLLDGGVLKEQGFLSRCLLIWPTSTVGTRYYVAKDIKDDLRYRAYRSRILGLFQRTPWARGEMESEVRAESMQLTPGAKREYVTFHDTVEVELREGGKYSDIRGFGNKAPEHALRLGALLTTIEEPDTLIIPEKSMQAAIRLMQYYLDEALRLANLGPINVKLTEAESLRKWLRQWPSDEVRLADIYQRGPARIREAGKARELMAILVEHGWVVPAGQPEMKRRRGKNEAYRITPIKKHKDN